MIGCLVRFNVTQLSMNFVADNRGHSQHTSSAEHCNARLLTECLQESDKEGRSRIFLSIKYSDHTLNKAAHYTLEYKIWHLCLHYEVLVA